MTLTVWDRIKICFEVLTSRSGHKHPSQEKQLSLFQRGYDAGFSDGKRVRPEEGEKAKEAMKNIKAVLKSTSSMRIDIINNISEAYQSSKE